MVDQKFAGLFLPAGAPDGHRRQFPAADAAARRPGPVRSSRAAGGRPSLAVNQREFEDADGLGGDDLLQTTSNLPVARSTMPAAAISFAGGSGDGLDLAYIRPRHGGRSSRSATFDRPFTGDDGFVDVALLCPPSPTGQGPARNGIGGVPGALLNAADTSPGNATFVLDYTIGHNGVGTNFQYDSRTARPARPLARRPVSGDRARRCRKPH